MNEAGGVSSIRVVTYPSSKLASALRSVSQVMSGPAAADTVAIRALIAARKSAAVPVVGSVSDAVKYDDPPYSNCASLTCW
jgi:hypothetical protein